MKHHFPTQPFGQMAWSQQNDFHGLNFDWLFFVVDFVRKIPASEVDSRTSEWHQHCSFSSHLNFFESIFDSWIAHSSVDGTKRNLRSALLTYTSERAADLDCDAMPKQRYFLCEPKTTVMNFLPSMTRRWGENIFYSNCFLWAFFYFFLW